MSFLGEDGDMHDSAVIFYDENGNVEEETTYTYTFDENGNMTTQNAYFNGVISMVAIYMPDDDGWMYLAHEIEYDDNGEIIAEYFYDADGNILE